MDEEEFIRSLLKKIVERGGYRSLAALSGQKALTLLESYNVTMVISEIVMPGVSGLDLLKKAKENYSSIPVILISGQSGKVSQDEPAKLADGFISIPFKNVEISRKLHHFTNR